MKQYSKRYKQLIDSMSKDKKLELKQIIDEVKKNSTSKFDESIDVSLRINIKQSKGGDLSLEQLLNYPMEQVKKAKLQFYVSQIRLMKQRKAEQKL